MTPIAHIRSAVSVIEALLRAIERAGDDDGEALARAMMAAEGLLRVLKNAASHPHSEHLERTPPDTKLCYWDGKSVVVLGIPGEDSDHNCDQMGCGQEHVVERIDVEALRKRAVEFRERAEAAEIERDSWRSAALSVVANVRAAVGPRADGKW